MCPPTRVHYRESCWSLLSCSLDSKVDVAHFVISDLDVAIRLALVVVVMDCGNPPPPNSSKRDCRPRVRMFDEQSVALSVDEPCQSEKMRMIEAGVVASRPRTLMVAEVVVVVVVESKTFPPEYDDADVKPNNAHCCQERTQTINLSNWR